MAKDADRPWVRQYVRKALDPVWAEINNIRDAIEDQDAYLEALDARITALEQGGQEPPSPPDYDGDELPDGGWDVVTNLESTDPQDLPVTRVLTYANFIQHPTWEYDPPIAEWPMVDDVEGNAWVICLYGGKWYMSTYEWLRERQNYKPGVTRENMADHTKNWQLEGWVPKAGDIIYFFNTTHVRNGTTNPSPQRSSVKRVQL